MRLAPSIKQTANPDLMFAVEVPNDEGGISKVCNGKGVFIAEVTCVLSLYAALLFG